MTDELAIQTVNPQVRKKDNTVPYALGGAVIGGAAGASFPMIKTKYSSWEDVLNESEDTFNKQIEKGGDNKSAWEAAKEQAAKVKEAEANYDKEVQKIKDEYKSASQALPDDNEAAKALKKAQGEYDAELAKKMKGSKATTVTARTNDILPYDANWSMTEAQRTEYQTLYGEYETAKTNFANRTTDLQSRITNRQTSITEMFDDILADADATIDPKSKKRRAIKSLDDYLASSKSTDKIEQVLRDKNLVTLSDTELIKLAGGESQIADTMPKAGKHETVFEITKKDGSKGFVKVQTSKKIGKTEYQRLLDSRFDQAVEQVEKDLKAYIETKKKLDNLPKTMKFDKGLVKLAQVTRNADGTLPLDDLANNLSKYESQIITIKQAKLQNFVPASGVDVTDTAIKNIMSEYGASSPKEAYEMLSARVGIARKYNAEKQSLQNVIDGIVNKDGVISNLKGRLKTLRNQDADLKKAESKIRGKFKNFIGKVTKQSSPAAEISEADAKKALEGSDIEKRLKAAQEAAKKEAEKLGLTAKELTDDELQKILKEKGLGTKAEYTQKLKQGAKETIEKNFSKYLKGNRLYTALAGAAILGLAGWGIGAATKKD